MSHRAICFAIMPFGKKEDAGGRLIDFDAVYREIISPAIGDAGLEAVRADDEMSPGVIHNAMFERLVLSEYAIADLTIFNPNVYYELGVRHAVRPQSTVLMSAGERLPFDVVHLRALLYALDAEGRPKDVAAARRALADRLEHCKRNDEPDSPLFRYAQGWFKGPQVDHEKTDVFRRDVSYSRAWKNRLKLARAAGRDKAVTALDAIRDELGDIATVEAGVVIDLFLSYRGADAHERMVSLYETMDPVLRHTTLAQEQYAFALNRLGRQDEAEEVLSTLIFETRPLQRNLRPARPRLQGPLGRREEGRGPCRRRLGAEGGQLLSQGLQRGLARSLSGDQRADTDGADPSRRPAHRWGRAGGALCSGAQDRRRRLRLLDYATLIELAVIAGDLAAAEAALPEALVALREPWEAGTTARNLGLIRDAWGAAGKDVARLERVIAALEAKAKG